MHHVKSLAHVDLLYLECVLQTDELNPFAPLCTTSIICNDSHCLCDSLFFVTTQQLQVPQYSRGFELYKLQLYNTSTFRAERERSGVEVECCIVSLDRKGGGLGAA